MKKRNIAILIAIVAVILFYFIWSFFSTAGGTKKFITNNSESMYKKSMKIEYPQILKLDIYTQGGILIFNYKLKDNTTEKIIREIFQKNYVFISNDKLIQNIIFQPVQSEYVKSIWVNFDLKDEMYRFSTRKVIYNSGNDIIDNYKTWIVLKNDKEIDIIKK